MSCVRGRSHSHTERIIYVLKCSEVRVSNCCFVPEVFSPHPLICVIVSLFNCLYLTPPHCLFSLFCLHFSWHFLFSPLTFSFAPLFHFNVFVWFNFLFAFFLSFSLFFTFIFLCQLSLSLVLSPWLPETLSLISLNALSESFFFFFVEWQIFF